MLKKVFFSLLSIVFLVSLVACGSNSTNGEGTSESSESIKVATTIAQIQDIVKNVGGENVEVSSLMGPGTDPHTYNAVQGDIEKLNNADVIFYNGLHLEGQMGEIFEKMKEQKPTIAVGENIPENQLLSDPEDPSIHDPHVWFSVENWKYAVEAVRDELIDLDKANEESYTENANAYLNALTELEGYIKEKAAEIPEESRVLVTAHDAFNYFGEEYGFDVVGLQGISTESDFSVSDVQKIVDTLVDRDIKGVFVESSVNERSINAVVEGAKEAGHEVSIGGELYSDAMGEAGTEEGTYVGMFKHNIDTIVDALK
ncbi:manganese-binding lipoprotein MntA [Paraliobacillus ryukyuensis]|uniref:Manganese/zinc/iron transport system substrate-binding protein n=1 Tax=Paraliobacillus ryukyuensis TaxID=200904 RepID=A0A366E7N7_9BACI|nr:zinc ABC transporter substrate-binding protein [Paraliobacillus ryukyuensis]RBO98322.1 manganese/zinc/iron transport system substrate-binding protein [Paraliobacillus ryukyuensis]